MSYTQGSGLGADEASAPPKRQDANKNRYEPIVYQLNGIEEGSGATPGAFCLCRFSFPRLSRPGDHQRLQVDEGVHEDDEVE